MAQVDFSEKIGKEPKQKAAQSIPPNSLPCPLQAALSADRTSQKLTPDQIGPSIFEAFTISGFFPDSLFNESSRTQPPGSCLLPNMPGQDSNIRASLEWFPQLSNQLSQIRIFLEDSTKLPTRYKYYIGIIAASSVGCEYLLRNCRNLFLQAGGDEDWIDIGLAATPQAFRIIAKINKVLLYKPWVLYQTKLVRQLLDCDLWKDGQVSQAVFVLTFFQSLCLYCNLLDLKPQKEGPLGTKPHKVDLNKDQLYNFDLLSILQEDSSQQAETLSQTAPAVSIQLSDDQTFKCIARKLGKYFDTALHQGPSQGRLVLEDEYDFNSHTFPLLQHFSSEMARLASTILKRVKTMTYFNLGQEQNINTSRLRRTIRHSLSRLLGYQHCGFNFTTVQQQLGDQLMQVIRQAAFRPHLLDGRTILGLGGMELMDVAHVGLLLFGARWEVTLIAAFREVEQQVFHSIEQ